MLHTKFVEIGPPVKELKILDRFFTIWRRGGHLGHLTSIMSSDFHFLVPVSFRIKVGSDLHGRF